MTDTTASDAGLVSDVMVSFAQILEGDAPCEDCGKPANAVLNCEPDYHDAPMCWMCARPFVAMALYIGDKWWLRDEPRGVTG